ncbi:MAG: hypothetical protein LBU66_04460, partial [Treponema sp.]|nr:hypothetical protein [Treponema sp.]
MASFASHSAQVLSEEEKALVEKTEDWLKEKNPQDYNLVHRKFQLLKNLGEAVFEYPSIKETKYLREILVNENQLTESLLAFSASSHLLRTPAKVAALRSFLVAKFHAFYLLAQMTAENEEFHTQTKNISFSIVFTLMAEAVYFSCL